jgi:hypothetical protein
MSKPSDFDRRNVAPQPLSPIDNQSSPADLLDGYIGVKPFAEKVNRCERTIIRWMDAPDGLPYTTLGNRRLIHVETARDWIFSRMQQRNPSHHNKREAKSQRR